MNCKPGDLAYIVAPYVECGRGHFVTVERVARRTETFDGTCYHFMNNLGPAWVCSGAVPCEDGSGVSRRLVIADVCLRPIRDQPGEDQPLQWAGLPARQGVLA